MTTVTDDKGAAAALDCGTNSTRLLIVDAQGQTLDRQMRVTRLGQGVDTTRKLAPEAIDRTLAVLADYRKSMDAHGVVRARLAATSAARDATNCEEFLSPAEEITGVTPEVLSGDEEGRLSFRGATADLPHSSSQDPELIVDIGGGSTEMIIGVPGDEDSLKVLSIDIGCVRVTERLLISDPPTTSQMAEARRVVKEELTKAREYLGEPPRGGRVIGLAGTVSTLGSLALGMRDYERDRVHHTELTTDDVETWLSRLASEPVSARKVRPGMDPGRADVIVGGVLILAEVMSVFGKSECLVSEADILDGMVAGLL